MVILFRSRPGGTRFQGAVIHFQKNVVLLRSFHKLRVVEGNIGIIGMADNLYIGTLHGAYRGGRIFFPGTDFVTEIVNAGNAVIDAF